MPTNKKNLILIKDLDGTAGSLHKIGNIIRSSLPRNILFSKDPFVIVFHSLAVFKFTRTKYTFTDKESVAAQCSFILEKSEIYFNGKLDKDFKEKGGPPDDDSISHFLSYFVGLHQLPADILSDLEPKVKSDLRAILELIERYEKEPEITNYKEGIKRAEHRTKMLIDFYERCIRERDQIVQYLANGLEDRVIAKAVQDDFWKRSTFAFHEELLDRPYTWWYPRRIEYFDYKKINLSHHRLLAVSVKEIVALEKLYHSNKKLFYQKLKTFVTPHQIFQELKNYYIPFLPGMLKRKSLFEELEKLMRSKRWYGFTALALTQVEGLFSDMLHIISPRGSYGSLSAKVLAVKPHYGYDERNLDYFEYQLPFLRNSFLHSGAIGGRDFRLLSLDLLYDLHYLMEVFRVVNDPHLELHKLITERSTESIHGIKSLNHLFELVKKVKDRLKQHPGHTELAQLVKDWEDYELNVIHASAEIEYYLQTELLDVNTKVESLFTAMNRFFDYGGLVLDLNTTTMKDLKAHEEKVLAILKANPWHFSGDFHDLMELYTFAKTYNQYLPNCTQDVRDAMDNISRQNKTNFAKLQLIKPAFEPIS